MTLRIDKSHMRWLFLAFEFLLFIVATGWTTKVYIASRFAEISSPSRLEEAIRLDSENAAYHLDLGRILEYVPAEANPDLALYHFKRAVALCPLDPQMWLNLGGAYELRGQVPEAEHCFARANTLAPRIPQVQWAIGNTLLLHGDVNNSFHHFRVVLAGTTIYDQPIFDIAWKATSNASQVLEELIPQDLNAEFAYLDYLTALNRLPEAQAVWKRIAASPDKFSATRAGGFIDHLIETQHSEDAFRAWTALRQKGLVGAVLPPDDKNLVANGSFEADFENMGFGWHAFPAEDFHIWRDPTEFHSPSFSLAIEFLGLANIQFRNVFQYVRIEPGKSYELDAYMKTRGITTDSGPRLEVRDPYDPSALEKLTDDVNDDSIGWIRQSLRFTAGPRTQLITVGVVRVPSSKLDNKIAGRVWVDDVRIIPIVER
jgi:hypothetical protein